MKEKVKMSALFYIVIVSPCLFFQSDGVSVTRFTLAFTIKEGLAGENAGFFLFLCIVILLLVYINTKCIKI